MLEGDVPLVVGVGVGRAQPDGGVAPVGEDAAAVAQRAEQLHVINHHFLSSIVCSAP